MVVRFASGKRLVSEPDPHTQRRVCKLAYMNSLWDVASLQASYAIIGGVDWVQIYMQLAGQPRTVVLANKICVTCASATSSTSASRRLAITTMDLHLPP